MGILLLMILVSVSLGAIFLLLFFLGYKKGQFDEDESPAVRMLKDDKKTQDKKEQNLFINTDYVKEEDIQTGCIYVLKSKSTNPNISSIENLYKIGFSSTSVDERIKNAKNEATYLFADVKKIATYQVYNRNADKLENLIHRFFAQTCLNVDLFDKKGQRITPREWFVVPFEVIEEVIELILNETIVNYEYDVLNKKIKIK